MLESVAFVTANYKREQVLKLYCEGIERLRRQSHIRIESVIVGDENNVTKDYNCYHIPYNNDMLTRKFNVAAQRARTLDVDGIIISGSDDLYNDNLFNYITSQEEEFVHYRDVYFFSLDGDTKGELRYLTSSSVGCGRLLRRSLLDRVDWKICNLERLWGVDQVVWRTILRHIESQQLFLARDIDGKCVDLKSAESMNLFTKWKGLPKADVSELYSWLSPQELDILNQILNKQL